jgi:hypothetical protein
LDELKALQILFFRGYNTDAFSVVSDGFVDYHAIRSSEESIIASDTNIAPWFNAGTTLAYQDVSRKHGFTAKFLHTQTLSIAITTVAARAAAFFMSHGLTLSIPM